MKCRYPSQHAAITVNAGGATADARPRPLPSTDCEPPAKDRSNAPRSTLRAGHRAGSTIPRGIDPSALRIREPPLPPPNQRGFGCPRHPTMPPKRDPDWANRQPECPGPEGRHPNPCSVWCGMLGSVQFHNAIHGFWLPSRVRSAAHFHTRHEPIAFPYAQRKLPPSPPSRVRHRSPPSPHVP